RKLGQAVGKGNFPGGMHFEEIVQTTIPQYFRKPALLNILNSIKAIRSCAFDCPPTAATNNANSCWHQGRSSQRFDKTIRRIALSETASRSSDCSGPTPMPPTSR